MGPLTGIERVTLGSASGAVNAGSGSCVAVPTAGRSRSYVGSVFLRTCRFDQFSTVSP